MNRYISSPGIFGGIKHYDESGKLVAESWEGFVPGSTVHYGTDGSAIGSSMDGLFGETKHFDMNDNEVAYSAKSVFGLTNHYNTDGDYLGSTWDSLSGESTDIDFDF